MKADRNKTIDMGVEEVLDKNFHGREKKEGERFSIGNMEEITRTEF